MTKLNKKRVKWLIDQIVKNNKKPKDICAVYDITERRVQQLIKSYRETKKYPGLKSNRRPKTNLSYEQEQVIETAYNETLLSPKLLYYELKRRGAYAPKNKIYLFMKGKGLIKNEPNKQKKRKRCRYEREHSGSLIHADYHRTTENHPHCIFWLDDASRKILSGGEFNNPNTENAIATFKEAENKFERYDCKIQQVNTDRASVFIANKNEGVSEFQKYCESKGIRLVPSGVKNPQTNGKVERRWYEYDKHRWKFKRLQEWIDWYNNRLTTALDIEHYETPNQAFVRKLPNLAALFWRLTENGQSFKKTK